MPRSRSPSPRRRYDAQRGRDEDHFDRRYDSRNRRKYDDRRSPRNHEDVRLYSRSGDRDRIGGGSHGQATSREDRKEGSRSHEKHSSRSERRWDRSLSEDGPLLDLRKLGVDKIKDEDYFLKSSEFKYWLKESRAKYLDELSSDSAHRYFRKFVRRWNDGALKEKYYFPPKSSTSGSQTNYKWSFNPKASRSSPVRGKDTDLEWQEKPAPLPAPPSADESSDDEIGPSLPSAPRPPATTTADLQLAKEDAADRRRLERKAERREAYNRADEMVPRGVGKEGKMQEKKAANEENKKYREKDATEGLEADEGTLMGDSGSFAAALRARDGAAAKRQERKEASMADRAALDRERLMERKQKDSETMEMFKAMAKQRFG